MNKIDFVITWVDGSDKNWQKEKQHYLYKEQRIKSVDSDNVRYRDWGTLKYLFRGIEKYAPWVNHVYLLTNGQVPDWINTNNKKLSIVFHKDFIPAEYLPTFSSHPIELNMYRIESLQDQFVLFNDDMFIIDEVKPTDFFKNGLPCDSAVLSPIISGSDSDFSHILINNIQLINKHFNKKEVIKKEFRKFFNPKYGFQLLRTVDMMPWKYFVGFYNHHLPYSFLKKTFKEIWELEAEKLNDTCMHRFRNNFYDVSPWLMRYWQLVSGNFYPRSTSFGQKFNYSANNKHIYDTIVNKKFKVICLNDDDAEKFDFDTEKINTINAFETNLNKKSSFEK